MTKNTGFLSIFHVKLMIIVNFWLTKHWIYDQYMTKILPKYDYIQIPIVSSVSHFTFKNLIL